MSIGWPFRPAGPNVTRIVAWDSILILDGGQSGAKLIRTGEDDLVEGDARSSLIVVGSVVFFFGRCPATPN